MVLCSAGLQLRRTEGKEAMENLGAFILGLASILFITPLASKAILMLKLQPYELAVGLAVFCCMPTSLSANIALTAVRSSSPALK
jgi:solute carrier family 10 (sodium/bile acid cotransporter), member 7